MFVGYEDVKESLISFLGSQTATTQWNEKMDKATIDPPPLPRRNEDAFKGQKDDQGEAVEIPLPTECHSPKSHRRRSQSLGSLVNKCAMDERERAIPKYEFEGYEVPDFPKTNEAAPIFLTSSRSYERLNKATMEPICDPWKTKYGPIMREELLLKE